MEAAVAYIRVSSQRQVDEGGSLDIQTRQVGQHAEAAGYDLVRIFREEGESAKTDQRPRLQEMLAYCRDKRNSVRVVIIPKIDRLARNVSDYTNLKLQLSRLGIRLESLGERIEDTPVGRFTETILASVAQFDNEIRAERSKGGMVEAVEQGRWVWKPPLGYRTVRHQGKGTIEPDPVAAPLVREAFETLAGGHARASSVLLRLQQGGLKTSNATLTRMVDNPVYVGQIRAFGKVFEARPPFVALVDEITFRNAHQALRGARPIAERKSDSEDFPLRGAMLCPCGRRYTASWSRGKQGKRYPYYRCVHCRGRSYPRERVHGQFLRELGAYKGVAEAWDRLRRELEARAARTLDAANRQQEAASARVRELQALRGAVALKNASGIIPDDLAKAQIDALGEEIASIAAGMTTFAPGVDMAELVEFARGFFGRLDQTWRALSLKSKKDLLSLMFPEGVLYWPERGFRTHRMPLSERLKQAVSGDDFRLVDPAIADSKELLDWLLKLRATVSSSERSP